MPVRASQARPANAPRRSSLTRPPDWALDLGLGSRPAPLVSISVHRLRHQPRSPPAQNHLGASSSAHLVDRPLSTPTAARRLADAFRRGPRRYKTRSKQGGRALLQRDSRCVLVLPTSFPWPPSLAFSRPRQLLETLRGRDDELTRAPRAQGGHARRVDGPDERRWCWRSTSSGSSRSLYVPPAHSSRATGSSMHSCTSVSRALTSFTVCAGQSSPRWHPLPFASRKLVSSLAGRLPTAPVDAHDVSSESSRTQAVQKARLVVPTRPGGRAPRAVRDGSYRGRTRPHVPLRAAGALWCVARTDTAPVARPCARPPLKNRGGCAPSLNCYLLI